MIRPFRPFWTWLMNFLSGPPPREIPCGCGDEFPEPTCTRCMTTGFMPVSEKEYQEYQTREKERTKNLKSERTRICHAYLVGSLDTSVNPPVVTRVNIFSSNANNLTIAFGEFPFDITYATGDGYQEAHDNLVQSLKNAPGVYNWIKPLFVPKGTLD